MLKGEVCPIAKLETILLATDGSDYSEGAVREAIRFANKCTSRLFVISVVETNPELAIYAPDVVEKIEKKTFETLKKIKERAEGEGITCEVISHSGESPHKYIVEEAERLNADIIIMGRRGRRGLMKLMMGSVTALVIGHAPCKVFVVPRAAELKCEKILVATDGSEYSEKAVREAISIAKRFGSSIVAISVEHRESDLQRVKDNVRHIRDFADKEGVEAETFAITGTPYESIVTTAQVKNADLIVIGSHGRTGLRKLLMGSVAERVIALAHCSVLVLT